MKRLTAILSASLIGLVGLVGCGKEKEGTTGGPGATNPDKPIINRPENTFNITTSPITVKAGSTADGAVGIKRGSGFEQDVSLEFSELPKGISLSANKATIPNKAAEAKFVVTAAEDVTPGDYTVKVVGQAASGPPSNGDFKLTVKPRATFTIGVPFWTTGIKQGETKQFSVTVSREKEFTEDVALKIDGLPKGVTVEPANAVLKNGETEAKLLMKAADEAPVGDHVAKVTGHPTKGNDVTHDLKFTVNKK